MQINRVVNSSALVRGFRFGWSIVPSTVVNLVQRPQYKNESEEERGIIAKVTTCHPFQQL